MRVRIGVQGCVPSASAGLNAAGLAAGGCERWRRGGRRCLPDLSAGRKGDMVASSK